MIAYFLCLHQNPLIHKSVFQTDQEKSRLYLFTRSTSIT
ncbi:hypothetical protein CHCC15290_2703 [Bacillus licheniformis]|nr:hypothetical protein B4092_0482 [Bacillus licheniformis]TWN08703.1 hypothetical protein CHCC14564_2435 [Bacillus licheniformis LMG 17339]KYC77369.1 hypothetical protein B4090_0586 [Bacillus licheniformis]TWJ48342.1 hypothetical protein CHCC5025_0165 [Bacillus licheniformis]TWJ69661.1 hypothetical protein CHCC5020_3139 [Bacillus licheniformis]